MCVLRCVYVCAKFVWGGVYVLSAKFVCVCVCVYILCANVCAGVASCDSLIWIVATYLGYQG